MLESSCAMKRNAAPLILIAVILLAVVVIAEAQPAQKIARIGFLAGVSPATISARTQAFREGLRELGYVEGKNIVIEWRYAAHAITVAAWTGAAKYFFDHKSHFSLLTRPRDT